MSGFKANGYITNEIFHATYKIVLLICSWSQWIKIAEVHVKQPDSKIQKMDRNLRLGIL